MIKIDEKFDSYIQKLKTELYATFGSGTVIAHIDFSPAVLSPQTEDSIDFSMVACDLVCDFPAATYDINIIVETQRNFDELDTPRVSTLEEAKNLAILIAQQVQGFQIYP
ncbi:hypothetical protein ABK814_18205 [Enterobacter hormaechei]|uniref:hypothetical protein n=1 Tax=Enterobacteriaceae TaxID=543 RepID=UPI0007C8759C|nr:MULTISPECIES: hypothetical protein [Enterobacteriaceae]MDE4745168.1 hypothetical protein [Klebsiella pneumoniae]